MTSRLTSPRFLALAGTAVLWASAFPAIRVGVDGLGAAALSFLRLAVATVARLPLAVSTAALYLVPPIALAVSFVWLSEVPRPVEILGGAVTVIGVVALNRRPAGRPRARTAGSDTTSMRVDSHTS